MTKDSRQGDPEQGSFEDAFVKLREAVEALEAGNLPLEEAARLYEEGMRLAKACGQILNLHDTSPVFSRSSCSTFNPCRPSPRTGLTS